MQPTVYLTGATGFIGARLAEQLLDRGAVVRCLVREPSRMHLPPRAGLELVIGTLEDAGLLRESLAGCDLVYHLAALTSSFSTETLYTVNVGGTYRLAWACAAQPVPPRLVHVSSVAATGPIARGRVRTEADRPNPISHYGRSKRGSELAILHFAAHTPSMIIRPGIVFGERNRELLPLVQTIYRARIHPLASFETPCLSLIYIDDLVNLLLAAAELGTTLPGEPNLGPPGRGTYFACADVWPDYAQLGRMFKHLLDRPRAPLLHLPDPYPWLVAAGNELFGRLLRKKDTFNLDKIREGRSESWACSPAAAQRDLGFAPSIPLFERLRQTVAWYREAGWL